MKKIGEAIESFQSNEAFNVLEHEILELETKLEEFRHKQKMLRYEYKKIKCMPKPEEIDDYENWINV